MDNAKIKTGILVFLKNRGRIFILLGGLVAGIALLLVGSAFQDKDKSNATPIEGETLTQLTAYEQTLENEIAKLCSAVAGVSHVDVMVRLASGTSIIYAKDNDGKPSTVGSGSSESALYSSLQSPVIAGVGIVCKGGNDPLVQQTIIELVSTTLNVSSARVFVAGK